MIPYEPSEMLLWIILEKYPSFYLAIGYYPKSWCMLHLKTVPDGPIKKLTNQLIKYLSFFIFYTGPSALVQKTQNCMKYDPLQKYLWKLKSRKDPLVSCGCHQSYKKFPENIVAKFTRPLVANTCSQKVNHV